ncbi:hypothetical protein QR98_0088940 [Sarcoptes scabiei]|uniref:Uncharacterized protein n=1 Tax=Sarcoptes scabiei TaxID=52283 RepID=A0A132AIQ4_SARSC|nr:hypothetical protein QR98_0088940 [Sarcoptes scabiei]
MLRKKILMEQLSDLKFYAINLDDSCSEKDWFKAIIEWIRMHFNDRMPHQGFSILASVYSQRFKKQFERKQFKRRYYYFKYDEKYLTPASFDISLLLSDDDDDDGNKDPSRRSASNSASDSVLASASDFQSTRPAFNYDSNVVSASTSASDSHSTRSTVSTYADENLAVPESSNRN